MIDKALFALPGVRKVFPILAGLAILQAVVILGQALFLSGAITQLWQGQGFKATLPLILGFFICFLAREGVSFIRQKFLDGLAYKLSMNLREELLDKIFKLGPTLAADMGSGSLTATTIAGIEQVESYIKLVLSKVLNMMIVPVLLLVAIIVLDWESSIVLVVAFPFAIIFMILLGYAAQGRASRQYRSYMLLSNHFLDSLRGISTLKYFGLSKSYANSIYRTSERFRKATMSTLRMAMLSTFALDFFATLSVATVALFLGLKLMDGHILLFPALAVLILAPEYFLPLREFASDYHATLNGKNALKSVNDILSADEQVQENLENSVQWMQSSTLTLQNVTKIYETGRGVQDVTAEISGFQKVAIVGASGSGKSTLLSMLSGFLMPTAGEFQINVDKKFSSLTDENWRKSLSFIPQNTYIFAGTLRENLAFYAPEATDDEILQAADLAGLSELVNTIGLSSKIGASGRTLSGGQMQRVALARAFLSNTRNILLLDEPTAHLDIETELEIKENILPLLENKLVFLATHRLHWLPQMDVVIVLNEGKVEGIGSHEQLLAENSYYQQLIKEMRG
ncbi:thiol reductant ABC exporter subunit CydD [Lactococcus nasutitermitis]|uniref:Thiol reductant ABC exporter subunit CydD n=1 Tax=Lactococcus nasutitermitis TaxID=1652957 RepID=A0ABV9J9L7_9LACT|nr:thiol reductant ABC exporter subunit CydD [Lactococcus nasutitermitis]